MRLSYPSDRKIIIQRPRRGFVVKLQGSGVSSIKFLVRGSEIEIPQSPWPSYQMQFGAHDLFRSMLSSLDRDLDVANTRSLKSLKL